MCLGVPGKVVEVNEMTALVDFWGVRKPVLLHTVDEPVSPGDYVLVHVGFAIRRIPPEETESTLAFYEALLQATEEDLLRTEIQDELRSVEEGP
ncbi:MAG: HypC/HybG/HupF family hydrogenase formation chaperone [Thermoflexus sp.]|jgi:hydrogenase expression/formation protein HypC|nr:HypC/HybG/HupF family hydrogenase formation chaperone [Thermoflexus sp.]